MTLPSNILYYIHYRKIGHLKHYLKNTKKPIILLPRPHCYLI